MNNALERWLVFFSGNALPFPFPQVTREDWNILAVDGGSHCTEKLNWSPDIWIGDGDSGERPDESIPGQLLNIHKDELDGEVALDYLMEQNAKEIVFFNFLQGRWDMSITHLFSLFRYNALAGKLRLFTEDSLFYFCRGSESFQVEPEAPFSVIPFVPMNEVSIFGGGYELHNGSLTPGTGQGLSNYSIDDCVEVNVTSDDALYLFMTRWVGGNL
jgi:thiamine pyrophosphokinase